MTQNNFRKEPVFGEPVKSAEENNQTEPSQMTTNEKPYVSLHSTQAPGHTFTPIMERVEENVESQESQPAEVSRTAKEFKFTPSSESSESVIVDGEDSSAVNAIKADQGIEINTTAKSVNDGFTTERIIPNATAAMTGAAAIAASAAIDSDKRKAKMPPKTRRLLLVGLLILALLVLFFLLKPSTPETVEELQAQQGNSLPIEFRPVDEEEAKRAEEQARAEQEAAAKAQEQQAQTQQTQEQAQQNAATQPVAQNESALTEQLQNSSVQQPAVTKPVENKPVTQPVVKPKTQGSVVYQPENTKPKAQPKTEPTKVAAKPAQEKAPVKRDAETVKTSSASVSAASTKTMTVPKGVSLMQVFRDNNLNIADVNAMSKVNNVVSNLKVGERITVRLDQNNRVVEMTIGSGGKFTRQSNGSYTFK